MGETKMVTTSVVPTLTIARYSFGNAALRLILSSHLFSLSTAYGITSTPETIDGIIDDIVSGYGYLKITEIMLAFKMMREGRFREGRSGESNRSRMFGSLSSEVICDCINRFCYEYRNAILDKADEEERRKREEDAIRNQATPEQRRLILAHSFIKYPKSRRSIEQLISKEDMDAIKLVIEEMQALRLLKTRVEEFLITTDSTDAEIEALRKGVNYINSKFPDVNE